MKNVLYIELCNYKDYPLGRVFKIRLKSDAFFP